MLERHNGLKNRSIAFGKELRTPVLTAVGVGAGAGLAGVAGITLRPHRELTHRSVVLNRFIQKAIDTEESTIGMRTNIWASVHRIHHEMADASLYPFYRIARLVQWMGDHPELEGKVAIPEAFAHLDPFVEKFGFADVMDIGALAMKEMQNRLGAEYQEPQNYSLAEIHEILNPTGPQYQYRGYKPHKGPFTQDDIARLLLTDPHSPALCPPVKGHKNGFRYVLLHNVGLYKGPSDLFKARPDLMPEDLQREDDVPDKSMNKYVVGGFVAASAAALLVRGKYRPKDFAIAAAAGSAANGVKMLTGLSGGNFTNSIGHLGPLSERDFLKAIMSRDYEIKINPEDGTVSTNAADAGTTGKIVGKVTYDEALRQHEHHQLPHKADYTRHDGEKGQKDAPWGTAIARAAANPNIPFIHEGEGFPEGQRRPDKPHEGVQIIQSLRVADLQRGA